MGALARRSSYGYSKLDKEDPEEVKHRRAQFLIYKALQQADSPRRRPSLLRLRLCRLKIKIGKKLKKLRKGMLLSISAARVRVYEQVTGQWKRLFGNGEAIASLPPMLALNAWNKVSYIECFWPCRTSTLVCNIIIVILLLLFSWRAAFFEGNLKSKIIYTCLGSSLQGMRVRITTCRCIFPSLCSPTTIYIPYYVVKFKVIEWLKCLGRARNWALISIVLDKPRWSIYKQCMQSTTPFSSWKRAKAHRNHPSRLQSSGNPDTLGTFVAIVNIFSTTLSFTQPLSTTLSLLFDHHHFPPRLSYKDRDERVQRRDEERKCQVQRKVWWVQVSATVRVKKYRFERNTECREKHWVLGMYWGDRKSVV